MEFLKVIYHTPSDEMDIVFMVIPIIVVIGVLFAIYYGLAKWLGEGHILVKIYRKPADLLFVVGLLLIGFLTLILNIGNPSETKDGAEASNKNSDS